MTTVPPTIATLDRVRGSADQKRRAGPRQVGALADFDFTCQGDLYIYRLPEVPEKVQKVKRPSAQVAPGNTQGSRHVIGNLPAVTVYQLPSPNALQGPIIDAPSGFTLEHPEHGHQQFPAGVYAITYQRAYADELRRVAD